MKEVFQADFSVSKNFRHAVKKNKKETGVEFQKYIQELRLDFAMNLLKLSKLSVTEACFESGFNTLPHFSQTFKKKFGMSPETIKQQL